MTRRSGIVHLCASAVVDEHADRDDGDHDDHHAHDDAGDGSWREAAVLGRRRHGAHVEDGRVGDGAPVVGWRSDGGHRTARDTGSWPWE